jgi:hypothetical protein
MIFLKLFKERKDLFEVKLSHVKSGYSTFWAASIRVKGEPDKVTQYLDQLEDKVNQHEEFKQFSKIKEPRLLSLRNIQNLEAASNQNPWATIKEKFIR